MSLPERLDSPRVYVAGRTSDQERVRKVQAMCRFNGYEITFDWTGAEGEVRTQWHEAPERGAEISSREVEACQTADLLILLCSGDGGLGCFVEFGAALASGTRCVVVDPGRDSVFYWHPLVVQTTWDLLPAALSMREAA